MYEYFVEDLGEEVDLEKEVLVSTGKALMKHFIMVCFFGTKFLDYESAVELSPKYQTLHPITAHDTSIIEFSCLRKSLFDHEISQMGRFEA